MTRIGTTGTIIRLGLNFYSNNELFDPFYVGAVKIYHGDALIDTLVPTHVSVGYYQLMYLIPSNLSAGIYNDVWEWRAEDNLSIETQSNEFVVELASNALNTSDGENLESVTVVCRSRPTWPWRVGLENTEDVGNGMGVSLIWI